MNIIIWNCRGCNGEDFRRSFRALLDWYKPLLVAFVETKMQDHQTILDDFTFNNMIQVPVNGNFGCLAALWDDSILELDEIATTRQEIHAMVKVLTTNNSWLFSCIYASTYRESHKILWDNLKTIKDNFDGSWLLVVISTKFSTLQRKKVGDPLIRIVHKSSGT
ncbi:hypothetical protein R3W88_017405 [Solanum pinnatisectum]|uniref:Endonuclease/exonuclease/phosphatase domain-containing protein n=1 Tax=Solanum pinnatisectum TaxID=50273 RepID=A0AAV9L4A7_9SOLN|nr:hypothetical protein R3W88_017405 [Solanum pinnatisectum]